MFFDADLTQKLIEAPINRWCDCGHIASLYFKRDQFSKEESNRFFLVSGNGINGIYCEFCLIVAYMMKDKNKINI